MLSLPELTNKYLDCSGLNNLTSCFPKFVLVLVVDFLEY